MVDEVTRGTRKRFEIYITDLAGNAQNPDTCEVTLIKQGEYSYDSPRGSYSCSQTGGTGYWGADLTLSDSMTLGNWIAKFDWKIGSVEDSAQFEFIVVDKIRPFINRPNIRPNVQIVG